MKEGIERYPRNPWYPLDPRTPRFSSKKVNEFAEPSLPQRAPTARESSRPSCTTWERAVPTHVRQVAG